MNQTVNSLVRQRAGACDALQVLANKPTLSADERRDYDAKKTEIAQLDDQISRAHEAQRIAGESAQAVHGQERSGLQSDIRVAIVDDDPYTSDDAAKRRGLKTCRGLKAIAAFKYYTACGNDINAARTAVSRKYGERHPIVRAFDPQHQTRVDISGQVMERALITSVGASGGFIVPPDYMNEIIELLRPTAVVRASGPRVIPMPRGTMTLPAQTAAGIAGYGGEIKQISSTQQTVGQIVASYKKLTALTPVSNDLMRYADPAADAFVRDDLVKIIALREDLAFLTGDGTSASPMGYTGFANRYAVTNAGTAGLFSSTANSTAAAGGNWITSNETFTLATAATELGGLVNKLDTANVPDIVRCWFMHPRTFNYLNNVQNSLGVYVYRAELSQGTLLSYPFKKSTQIPINIWDTSGTNKDCSFLILAEMDESMILDSMSLELAVSREGMYVDANSNTVSAFQQDQTLIRAIAEHDFQLRHDAAVAVAQFVRWAPQLT